ncbi:MAG: ThuA domain-containing protein [Kiritimatiellae bacterium]|nr:ThuA domain-containing protein [Kiritimatiellia bacterium]
MKRIFIATALAATCLLNTQAADEYTITPEWQAAIEKIAPEKAMATPKKERSLLVFSLITGFDHKVTPKTSAVVKLLGEKSGAWKVVESNDIEQFTPENLKAYDAVVLNNNCPTGKDRDIFRDVLINLVDKHGAAYKDLPLAEREAKAKALLASLMSYVENGGGLIALHGAIANFNYNDDFSAMMGGSFHFHPAAQELALNVVDKEHPLTKCFGNKPFVHKDEPYLFNRAYEKMNFKPLLEMDMSNIKDKRLDKLPTMKRYTAWIKRHGKGHVFYCSPSHFPASFDQPALLHFMLGGIQYALGDLECDDAPVK